MAPLSKKKKKENNVDSNHFLWNMFGMLFPMKWFKGKGSKNYMEKMSMTEKTNRKWFLVAYYWSFLMWCRAVATVGGMGSLGVLIQFSDM